MIEKTFFYSVLWILISYKPKWSKIFSKQMSRQKCSYSKKGKKEIELKFAI